MEYLANYPEHPAYQLASLSSMTLDNAQNILNTLHTHFPNDAVATVINAGSPNVIIDEYDIYCNDIYTLFQSQNQFDDVVAIIDFSRRSCMLTLSHPPPSINTIIRAIETIQQHVRSIIDSIADRITDLTVIDNATYIVHVAFNAINIIRATVSYHLYISEFHYGPLVH
jgi:hypothetical protein